MCSFVISLSFRVSQKLSYDRGKYLIECKSKVLINSERLRVERESFRNSIDSTPLRLELKAMSFGE